MHDDGTEDVALARRVAAGDEAAEGDLCRRLLPRVRAWGLRHLRDEAAALDLAQDVVLEVLEALREGRVRQPDRIAAFTLGVCRLTHRAQAGGSRRRAVLLERYGAQLAGVVEPRDTGPDRRRLAVCLEHLLPRARTILALSFYADRDTTEIADELGVAAGNVRVIRHRALRQLHSCMEADR